MIKAIYPGTFDPITIGHLDIISRASKIYDKLVVAIMDNPSKNCVFTKEERIELIKKCIKEYSNVEVVLGEGLTVDFARKMNCKVIVRGIRALTDYEYELAQATANMNLDKDIETVFLVAKPELSFLSSSIAKEIARFNGDIKPYIPKQIIKDVQKKID